jgi:hypothetical protein
VVIRLQHRGFEEVPCELTKRRATLKRKFAAEVEAETKEREQKKTKTEEEVDYDGTKSTSLRNAHQSKYNRDTRLTFFYWAVNSIRTKDDDDDDDSTSLLLLDSFLGSTRGQNPPRGNPDMKSTGHPEAKLCPLLLPQYNG